MLGDVARDAGVRMNEAHPIASSTRDGGPVVHGTATAGARDDAARRRWRCEGDELSQVAQRPDARHAVHCPTRTSALREEASSRSMIGLSAPARRARTRASAATRAALMAASRSVATVVLVMGGCLGFDGAFYAVRDRSGEAEPCRHRSRDAREGLGDAEEARPGSVERAPRNGLVAQRTALPSRAFERLSPMWCSGDAS